MESPLRTKRLWPLLVRQLVGAGGGRTFGKRLWGPLGLVLSGPRLSHRMREVWSEGKESSVVFSVSDFVMKQ